MTSSFRLVYVDHRGIADRLRPHLADDDLDLVRAESATDAIKFLHDEGAHVVVVPADLPDMDLDGFAGLARDAVHDVEIVAVGEPQSTPPEDVFVLPASTTDRALSRRIRTALTRRRVDAAVDRQRRLDSAIVDVLEVALDADDRDAVAATLYDRLTEVGNYEFVLVCRYLEDGEVEVVEPLGGRFATDHVGSSIGVEDAEFLDRAIESGEVTVTSAESTLRSASASGSGRTGATPGPSPPLAIAAVPLTSDSGTSGILLLSSRQGDAFSGAERSRLGRLGALVGRAMESTDTTARVEQQTARFQGIIRSVAHEIRNPLQIASTALQLAREGDETAFDRLADAHSRIERALDSIATIADADRMTQVDEVDLQKLILDVWEEVGSSRAELTISGLPTVRANHEMLERLLVNLLRNAIDHAGPEVSVRVGRLDGRAGFYVEDDGPGIPPERREEIFGWGVSGKTSGTGIGLGLVREICTAHDWDLEVSEGRAGGARFEIITGDDGESRGLTEAQADRDTKR